MAEIQDAIRGSQQKRSWGKRCRGLELTVQFQSVLCKLLIQSSSPKRVPWRVRCLWGGLLSSPAHLPPLISVLIPSTSTACTTNRALSQLRILHFPHTWSFEGTLVLITMALPLVGSGQWSTGFCDCSQDCGSCWCSICCPCVVVGRIAEIIDQGMTSCLSAGCIFCCIQFCRCGFLYTCGYRGRLRAKYGLAPEPCGDCCSDYWCLPCSLAHQYRELQHRGVDPALGWAANRVAYEQSAPAQQKMSQY